MHCIHLERILWLQHFTSLITFEPLTESKAYFAGGMEEIVRKQALPCGSLAGIEPAFTAIVRFDLLDC